MRFPAPLPALPLLFLFTAACATSGARGTSDDPDRATAQAADFSLRTMEGQNFRLSDHLGEDVIMLNFWATWCVPCQAEMPELEKLHQKFKDQGVQIIGISMDGPESIANVQPTVRRLGVTYPILLDEETRVVGIYNPRLDAPYTVLIDRSGSVAQRFVGYAPGDEVKLSSSIQKLLDQAPESGSTP